MRLTTSALLTSIALASAAGSLAGPASALTMKECSTKYQAAKQAGATSNWTDFRKAECGTTASTTPALAPTVAAARPAPSAPAPTAAAPSPKPMAATPAPASTGPVSYPSAVDPKYAKESAGKARMHTCLDGYKAAQASGTLGDMKWIQKGEGYYSTCNMRLKG